jgi:hypothetical protein
MEVFKLIFVSFFSRFRILYHSETFVHKLKGHVNNYKFTDKWKNITDYSSLIASSSITNWFSLKIRNLFISFMILIAGSPISALVLWAEVVNMKKREMLLWFQNVTACISPPVVLRCRHYRDQLYFARLVKIIG